MEDYYDRMGADPSQGMFPSPGLRKVTRYTTKTKRGHGVSGSRSKDERRIRREKRAQRSRSR